MSKTTLDDLLTMTMMTAGIHTVLTNLFSRKKDSEILTAKIDKRIEELKREEVLLIGTRAFLIELWQ